MNPGIVITGKLDPRRAHRDRARTLGVKATEMVVVPPGRVPRVARLMALAIRFDNLIRDGAVADQAELARLGHITRARATQIMNLLRLAPDIQEEVLFLSLVTQGRDPVGERELRPIAAVIDWRKQRRLWRELIKPQLNLTNS